MTRIVGPTGSRRRRRFLYAALLCTGALALLLAGSAQAIHDLQFQLDGDVSTQAYTVPTGSSPPVDWGGNSAGDSATPLKSANGLFEVTDTSTEAVTPNPALVPSVFPDANFQRDFESNASCPTTSAIGLNNLSTNFCTGDDTTYATGSKDTLGIGNGGWQCNHDNNVNSKIDIMNAYVASYINGAGDKIFYFGLEKNKNNGTNDVGIWFLKSNATCSAPSGHVNFTGNHSDGDVLVVSEFTQGGGVSTIKAFQWAANAAFPGDKGCIDSHDWPDPGSNAPGVVPAEKGCNGRPIGSGQDCKSQGTGSTDTLCATTNAKCTDTTKPCSAPWNSTVSTPWLTSDATLGVGHQAVSPDFFEGGINITKLFQQAGNPVPSCFNVIVPDTRSSAAITATLFDFVVNKIGQCKGSLSTQENAASPLSIGTGTVSSDTDTATLNISGTSVWDGTMTWYLCGPVATDACDSHGVLITTKAVHSTDSSHAYVSGAATLTSAGRYCWHAHFEPDAASKAAGVDPQDDNGDNECFTVNPVTPSLSTSASCLANPCVVGSTLNDSATLSGTASRPGDNGPGGDTGLYKSIKATNGAAADSSISWTLYGPASNGSAQCTTAITGAPTPSSVPVTGDNTYGPVSYVSTAVGTYTFAASYPSDSVNTNAAPLVACADGATNGEQVTTIGSASSSSAQRWLPNDRVVLNSTAGTTLHGTLTVKLYSGTFTLSNGVCTVDSGAVLRKTFGGTANNVSSNTNSFVFNTNNTDFFVGTKDDGSAGGPDGNYFWLIQYTDNSLTSPADRCEKTNLTITDNPT